MKLETKNTNTPADLPYWWRSRMVASLVACLGLLLSPRLTTRRIDVHMMADEPAEEEAGALINPADLDKLRARISRIQESGGVLATPSQKLFEIATSKPPSVMLKDFFSSASPMVQQGMQDAVVSLLGALPPFEFDSQAHAAEVAHRTAQRLPDPPTRCCR